MLDILRQGGEGVSERAATAAWPGLRPRDYTRAQELLGRRGDTAGPADLALLAARIRARRRARLLESAWGLVFLVGIGLCFWLGFDRAQPMTPALVLAGVSTALAAGQLVAIESIRRADSRLLAALPGPVVSEPPRPLRVEAAWPLIASWVVALGGGVVMGARGLLTSQDGERGLHLLWLVLVAVAWAVTVLSVRRIRSAPVVAQTAATLVGEHALRFADLGRTVPTWLLLAALAWVPTNPGDVRAEYFLYGASSMLVITLLEGLRERRR